MGHIKYLLLIFLWFKGVEGQEINTSLCGKSFDCFRKPVDCTSPANCTWLITYEYNKTTNTLNVQIGGKYNWIAFGLNSVQHKDGSSGHVCSKSLAGASLQEFSMRGNLPSFKPQNPGLTRITTALNPYPLCSFSRPVIAPSDSKMKHLDQSWYLLASVGNTFGVPDAGGASPNKVDFAKITESGINKTPAGNPTVTPTNGINKTQAGNPTVTPTNGTATKPSSASTVFGSTTIMAIGLNAILGLMSLA